MAEETSDMQKLYDRCKTIKGMTASTYSLSSTIYSDVVASDEKMEDQSTELTITRNNNLYTIGRIIDDIYADIDRANCNLRCICRNIELKESKETTEETK